MKSFNLTPLSPGALLLRLGERALKLRLYQGLTRSELSLKSNVPESTIKRFETTGELGTRALLSILNALGSSDSIEFLFELPPPKNSEDVLRIPRKRGRRSDIGKTRD